MGERDFSRRFGERELFLGDLGLGELIGDFDLLDLRLGDLGFRLGDLEFLRGETDFLFGGESLGRPRLFLLGLFRSGDRFLDAEMVLLIGVLSFLTDDFFVSAGDSSIFSNGFLTFSVGDSSLLGDLSNFEGDSSLLSGVFSDSREIVGDLLIFFAGDLLIVITSELSFLTTEDLSPVSCSSSEPLCTICLSRTSTFIPEQTSLKGRGQK